MSRIFKEGFKVDQSRVYADSTLSVAQLIVHNTREWDEVKVVNMFSVEDARQIMATRIPPAPAVDHLAWSRTTNGKYSVKTGYQLWHAQNIGTGVVAQSNGWKKLWKLDVPHKIKVFLWRVCRNNVPVKSRLTTKRVHLPTECSMCNSGVEDLNHLFFTCPFALACWHYVNMVFDMSLEGSVPSWLLAKLEVASESEGIVIAKVLWGIWFFRNKKIWENKVVTAIVAMDWSAKSIANWSQAKSQKFKHSTTSSCSVSPDLVKWKKPVAGTLKLNVDAAVRLGADVFSMGLVLRDSAGAFVLSKTVCKPMVSTVLEAEALAILEGLYWLQVLDHDKAVVESDSLLAVRALQDDQDNLLEVGHTLDACRIILDSKPGYSISFVKRQANVVAHLVAKLPCSLNCQNVITAPSDLLLESLLYDVS